MDSQRTYEKMLLIETAIILELVINNFIIEQNGRNDISSAHNYCYGIFDLVPFIDAYYIISQKFDFKTVYAEFYSPKKILKKIKVNPIFE